MGSVCSLLIAHINAHLVQTHQRIPSNYHHMHMTLQIQLQHDTNFPCVLIGSLKEEHWRGCAVIPPPFLSFFLKTSQSSDKRETAEGADRHNVQLLSSSLHKNLIYTLHSPSASLLILVCVCVFIVSWQTSIIMQHRETTLCPYYRAPFLLFLCFHYSSPLYARPRPSHRGSILKFNNAALCQCRRSSEDTAQTGGGSAEGKWIRIRSRVISRIIHFWVKTLTCLDLQRKLLCCILYFNKAPMLTLFIHPSPNPDTHSFCFCSILPDS